MRTSIVIDEKLIDAMKAGPYKTKRDAAEAGLKLLARKTHYREILKWEGKLKWEGGASTGRCRPPRPQRLWSRASPRRGSAVLIDEASLLRGLRRWRH